MSLGLSRSGSRRASASGLVLALAAALLGFAAPAAQAHNVLRATVPAADAQVDVPPSSVTLEFNEPALAAGTQIEVTGPDGAVVSAGDLLLSNATIAQPISATLAGAYRVVWRATSADGHPISGEFGFTSLGAAPAPEPTPSASDSPTSESSTAASEPTEEPSDESSSAAADATLDDAEAASGTDDGGSSTPWVLGGIAVVAVLGAAAGLLSARRRGRHGSGTA